MLVRGGPANSGTKRPLKDPAADWVCVNGHPNRGYASICLTDACREKRQDGEAVTFPMRVGFARGWVLDRV
jgi:hypothetical protein